ncbi:MAG: 2'-5' RNA ligase family protein [Cyclobacteriaceae bacterium]
MKRNVYMVVINPSTKATEDTIEFKKIAEASLGSSFRSRNSIPHLTVHLCEDFHNESKLYDFQKTTSQIKPFKIFIDGFGIFKTNGTIFLRPVFDENIRLLSEQLSGERITPHITIARNLKPSERDLLWAIFETMTYSHDFLCTNVIVLKRVNNRWLKHIELDLGSSRN